MAYLDKGCNLVIRRFHNAHERPLTKRHPVWRKQDTRISWLLYTVRSNIDSSPLWILGPLYLNAEDLKPPNHDEITAGDNRRTIVIAATAEVNWSTTLSAP
jgi:hypothetical protein